MADPVQSLRLLKGGVPPGDRDPFHGAADEYVIECDEDEREVGSA